jgi:3-methylcrotonyl-CoA carboxylase alpha subunit
MRTEYIYQAGGTTWTVSLERRADQLRVTVAGQVYDLKLLSSETGLLNFQLDGRQVRAYIAQAGSRRYVAIDGESWQLERVTAGQVRSRQVGSRSIATSGALVAEMPGQVLELLVGPGDPVAAGQTLVLLEAMKLELRITAPAAGQIRQVYCTQGQIVERGQALIEWEMMNDEG